ncbi:unnamed protein product [Lathyrus sativus]|nr:unnamed protein product [Lathyrus sativus]
MFTIHGLWPSNRTYSQPRECSHDPLQLRAVSPIKVELENFWPNLEGMRVIDGFIFWSKQWKLHGTCSSMNAPEFFNLALQIYHKNKLKIILDLNGIKPGGTKKEKIRDIFNAIGKGIGKKPQILCKMCYLLEIRVCLNKVSVDYIDCTGQLTINCPVEVYFP